MKLLITTLFLSASVFAQTLTYKVKAPLFGTVGEINVNYTSRVSSYNISANMHTFGFAKKMSGNRVEHYSANGSIKHNKYYAKHFVQDSSYKNKKSHLEYIFNYSSKKITKIRKKWKNGQIISNTKRYLSYFTYNDLFSVYHNIVQDLKNKPAGWYQVQVAGLEHTGGYLKIKVPTKAQQIKEAKSLGVQNVWIFHIITNKAIMKSKNGEIVFAVGGDGIAKAVRVLNIPFVSHLDGILQ